MSLSIGTTCVDEIMNRVLFTVGPKDKISAVARLFEQHDINAAPVVNESNVCIGVITSHDMAEYESTRIEIENARKRGFGYDEAHYGDARSFAMLRIPIDEVGIQMSSLVETADPKSTLSSAARTMCQKHIHHLIVLDESKQPVGMLSPLDILGHLLGEAVTRNEKNQNE